MHQRAIQKCCLLQGAEAPSYPHRHEEHSNEHIQKSQVPDATMTRRFCHLATPPAALRP